MTDMVASLPPLMSNIPRSSHNCPLDRGPGGTIAHIQAWYIEIIFFISLPFSNLNVNETFFFTNLIL